MHQSVRWAAMLVVAGAVACGGGGGSSYPTSSGNNGGGGGTPPPPPPTTSTTASVSIADYSFTPASLSIKAGTTVTWTNDGAVAHTATADGGAFDSGQLSSPSGGGGYGGGSAGGSYSYTFSMAGTYAYHCANHPTTMKGTITVTP